MHEVSLGGVIADYLTGAVRQRTTYEDLRQALARWMVEERGYPRERLAPSWPIAYEVAGRRQERSADLAFFDADSHALLLLMFCPGQLHTYQRETMALARLALPVPCPLAVVTDTRDAELFAVRDGLVLGRGLAAVPAPQEVALLAARWAHAPLSEERRAGESRILHAYTGFLKTCCSESCRPE